MAEHEAYMRRCLELARRAVQTGNGPFGALIVRDDHLVVESYNQVRLQQDVSAHAEINAIRDACRTLGSLDLTGCTLYTSAEPCFMCSYAIRMVRISQVVMGARASSRGGVSSRHPILVEPDIAGWGPPPHIVGDILLDECTALLHEHGFDRI